MWRINVDLSAASLRRMLCSLETHLECEDCKTQLTKHVDDIVVKWSLLDVSYLRTYRVRRSQIFDLRLFPAQTTGFLLLQSFIPSEIECDTMSLLSKRSTIAQRIPVDLV